jgi:hypothetical protein
MYTALRPVRFDRDYAIGDVIPGKVLSEKTVRRLVEQGRIAPLPTLTGNEEMSELLELLEWIEEQLDVVHDAAPVLAERLAACKAGIEGVLRVAEDLLGIEPTSDADPAMQNAPLQFPCPECDRAFATQQGLNSHMRVHNNSGSRTE